MVGLRAIMNRSRLRRQSLGTWGERTKWLDGLYRTNAGHVCPLLVKRYLFAKIVFGRVFYK